MEVFFPSRCRRCRFFPNLSSTIFCSRLASDVFEKTPKKEMPKKSKNFDALKNVTKTPKIPINITH